ncbi:MAG: sensor histidine kinase [Acidobacteriota bacterium]
MEKTIRTATQRRWVFTPKPSSSPTTRRAPPGRRRRSILVAAAVWLGLGAAVHAETTPLDEWRLRFGDDRAWASPDPELDGTWHRAGTPGPALHDFRRLRESGAEGVPDGAPFFVWFRTTFKTPHTAGPLGLFLGRLEDVDDTFLNGQRIGGEGILDRWPIPDKARGYRLPPGALAPPGDINHLAVRVQIWSSAGGLVVDPPFVGPWSTVIERRERSDRRTVIIDAVLVAASASNLVLWAGLWLYGQRHREHVLLGWVLIGLTAMQALEGLSCYLLARALDGQVTGDTTSLGATPISDLYPFLGLPIWTAAIAFVLHYLWSLTHKPVDRWLWSLDGLLVLGSLALLTFPGTRLGVQIFITAQAAAVVGALVLFLPAAVRARRVGTPGITVVAFGFFLLTVASLFYSYSTYEPTVNRAVTRASMAVFAMTLLVAFAQRHRRLHARADHLGAQLIDAAERVQRGVARDLHDGVIQRLAAHVLTLRHAERRGQWPAVGTVIDDLGDTSREVRAVVHELRPARLEQLGLGPALAEYCREVADTEGVDIRLDLGDDGLPDFSDSAAAHLFRIVQEALTNAVRHGAAGRIDVIGRPHAPSRIDLSIRDDGGGFYPHLGTSGLGLSILKERAHLLGAAFEIDSRIGGGTDLHIRGIHPRGAHP